MSGTIEYCRRHWLHDHRNPATRRAAQCREDLSEYDRALYDLFLADLLERAERFGWT